MKTRIPIGKLLGAGAALLTTTYYDKDGEAVMVKAATSIYPSGLQPYNDAEYTAKLKVWISLLNETEVEFLYRQGSGLLVEEKWTLEDGGG